MFDNSYDFKGGVIFFIKLIFYNAHMHLYKETT